MRSCAPFRTEETRVAGSHYTERYVRFQGDGALGAEQIRAALEEAQDEPGSRILRAVAFGDVDGPSPDPKVVVATGQWPASPAFGLEVQVVVPHPGADVAIEEVGPGATLVRTAEESGEVLRLVQVVAGATGGDVGTQVAAALRTVERTQALVGMEPRHLDRTWYFLSRIAGTYELLNAARDAAFTRWGLTDFPASTGIGAALREGEHAAVVAESCSVAGRPAARTFGTALQCAPVQYGPRFARATRMRRNGVEVVNISGISSIDDGGASLDDDSADVLVGHAMASFVDLLQQGGMGLSDVSSSYVYSKDAEASDAFARWCAAAGVDLPAVHNAVDVCRPDLRFEIEGRAVRRPS